MSVKQLEPDFVLNVKHKDNEKDETKKPQLKTLFDRLQKAGFSSTVRAGADPSTEILVFIKLLRQKYTQLFEEDLAKSFQFGVSDADKEPFNRPRIIHSYLLTPEKYGGVGLTVGSGDWSPVTSITSISGYLVDESAPASAIEDLKKPEFLTEKFEYLYGPLTALYFNFLKSYTLALGILSVLGFAAFLKSKNYSLTFSFLNVIWGTTFLIFWKRRERFLANTWGVQHSLEVEKYQAELATATSTGEPDTLKLRSKHDGIRLLKQFAFVPVALAFVAVLVSYQLACFVLEIFLNEVYDGPGKPLLALVPTVLISAFVPVLTIVFNLIANIFLNWEAHETTLTRTQSSVTKTFVLNFLTGYAPLIITAFIYLPFAHLLEPNLIYIQRSLATNIRSDRYVYKYLTKVKSLTEFQINQGRLNSQFFYFIVTNQVISLVVKYGVPLVLPHILNLVNSVVKGKQAKFVPEDESAQEKQWLEKVRAATTLPEYSPDDDFRIVAMQYGYLALFGPVWTLAPFVCVIFNILNFKLDEYKLASGKYYKPVIAKKTDTIYPWNVAFFLLTWIGSIISPIVTAFYRHGTKPPKPLGQFALDKASVNVSSSVKVILVLFFSEHLFFLLYVLGSKISDLLKSDKEIENDSFSEDVRLRGEYFKTQEKPQFEVSDDGQWSSLSAATALKEADSIHLKKVDPSEEKATGASSSISMAPAADGSSTLTNKQQLLEQKKRDLEQKKRELDAIRHKRESTLESHLGEGDSIVDTKDEYGHPSRGIIDDNTHADKYGTDFEKDVDPASQGTYNKQQLLNAATGDASSSNYGKEAPGIAGAGSAASPSVKSGAEASTRSSEAGGAGGAGALGGAGGAAAGGLGGAGLGGALGGLSNGGIAERVHGAQTQVNDKVDAAKLQINEKVGANNAIGEKVDGIQKEFNSKVDDVVEKAKSEGNLKEGSGSQKKLGDLTGELDDAKSKAQAKANEVQKKAENFNPQAGDKVGELNKKVEKIAGDKGNNIKQTAEHAEDEAKKAGRKKSLKNLLKRK